MRKVSLAIAVMLIAIFFVGCLAVDRKEYTWKIDADGSGTAKIVYKNIFSSGNTEEDMSADDFTSLIDDYIEGTAIDDELPDVKNLKKRLYVEDGLLCGEVTFEFEKLSDIGFYRYKGKGPFMRIVDVVDETYIGTNGDWGGEGFPVVFWPDGTTEFELTTSLGDSQEDGSKTLLGYYEAWEKTGELPDAGDSEE